MSLVCWVLNDSRAGNNNQAKALADRLEIMTGLTKKIINVEYNILGKVPNYLLPIGLLKVKSPNIKAMLEVDQPELIISAGRRTALISASIKKQYSQIKIIQILQPEYFVNYFDLIILPQHDKVIASENNNIIKIIGALNNVKEQMNKGWIHFYKRYPNLINSKYFVVLIGGDTKTFTYNVEDAKYLVSKLNQLPFKNKLFISFSRRTSAVIKEKFLSSETTNIVYDPSLDTAENGKDIYPGCLYNAQAIIVTPDSISMISEAASTGKPVYVLLPKNFNSMKHKLFCYQLRDLGIIKIIDDDSFIENYHYNALDELSKVAHHIKSKILQLQ